ncbi:MAG: ribosome silencing factor [Bacteroidota bacterium]|nr:ribosome silencing factor [Bacteroidota bacterium]
MGEPDMSSGASKARDKRRTTQTAVRALADEAIAAAVEKKAQGIVLIDMREVSGMADYFVVCTGDSDVQIKAIVEAVETRVRDRFRERPWHVEGADHRQWVLMDYVDLVVHIFTPERRSFYDLERLWGDAPCESIDSTFARISAG